MISKLFELIVLAIFGKKIVKYIWLLAIMSGFSTITWYLPHNIFSSSLVPNKEKKEYMVYRTMLSNVVNVIVPTIFGFIISEKSYEKTAIIVLALSIIQILLSFKLKYKEKPDTDNNFKLIDSYKKIRTDSNVKVV